MSDIDIPHVGKVPRTALIVAGVGVAALVGWRLYMARQSGADDGTGDNATDPGFDGESMIPAVPGGVSAPNTGANTDDTDPADRAPKTDAAWTNQVADKLQNASDRWSYADIVTALGNYLADRPTTSTQQDIIRAAIAVGGYPPVSGSHTIISGGNVPITVAPTGLHMVSSDASSVKLAWAPVAGAASYRVYRSGVSVNIATSTATEVTVGGLQPNTTYNFTVSAFTGSGVGGPDSSPVSAKTKTVTLAKPSTPAVSAITKTTCRVTTGTVANADGYKWYINGALKSFTHEPAANLTGFKSKTSYTVTVAADNSKQSPGPVSAGKKFTTK